MRQSLLEGGVEFSLFRDLELDEDESASKRADPAHARFPEFGASHPMDHLGGVPGV